MGRKRRTVPFRGPWPSVTDLNVVECLRDGSRFTSAAVRHTHYKPSPVSNGSLRQQISHIVTLMLTGLSRYCHESRRQPQPLPFIPPERNCDVEVWPICSTSIVLHLHSHDQRHIVCHHTSHDDLFVPSSSYSFFFSFFFSFFLFSSFFNRPSLTGLTTKNTAVVQVTGTTPGFCFLRRVLWLHSSCRSLIWR